MASVDKVKVGSTSYDISPSKDGTLNGFTSNDAASPSSWTATDVVAASDSNSTIFSKVTTMIKNVRWLYSKLGTTDFSATGQSTVTGALSALQSGLNGKAASSHSHNASQLPISSSQTNSNSYIPTSALVYSMQQQINSLNDATSDISGLIEELRPEDYNNDPNIRYSDNHSDLGTWSSMSDVDNFFAKYNNENGYKTTTKPLRLGDYVTIKDGTYNSQWMIAGFDMEHNKTAADGTVYDNGYGICFIPKTQVTTAIWYEGFGINGAYKSSVMHTSHLPSIVTKLQGVLGSHLIQRNVLLSSSVSGDISNGYTWTTAYATLMSIGQMTGTFASHKNKYDDGEANYKLPVFNFMGYAMGSHFWSRGVWGSALDPYRYYFAWYVVSDGSINRYNVNYASGVRPLIYLR